jgi:hypothetical protein
MVQIQNFAKVAGTVLLAVGLSACDQTPTKSEMDKNVDDLLVENAENLENLVRTGKIIEISDNNSIELMHVFIEAVQENKDELCASYKAYNPNDMKLDFGADGDVGIFVSNETYGETCISNPSLD